MGRPHVDPEVPECCQLETSMPRKRALAGVAVAKDPTSASANDAQTNANVATTTRKNLDASGDEADALSHVGASGVLCNGAMRKIRDSTEHQFYGHRLHPYLHPELRRETGMNTLCSTGTSRVQRRSDRRS